MRVESSVKSYIVKTYKEKVRRKKMFESSVKSYIVKTIQIYGTCLL